MLAPSYCSQGIQGIQDLTLRSDDAAWTSLPSPRSLVAVVSFWATSPLAVEVRHIFCVFFFFPQLCCPLRFQNSPQTRLWTGFLMCGNFSSFMTPSPGQVSIPKSFLSLSFAFCSTSFWREWAAFLGTWCPLPAFRSCFVEVAQHSNDFWGIRGGESGLPIPFLSHLGTALEHNYFKR